jgi:hypothetical protein
MLSATIRSYLKASPFQPFVIRMNDGREFPVPHPDFAAVSPSGGRIHLFLEDGGDADLSALLVASVHLLDPATS